MILWQNTINFTTHPYEQLLILNYSHSIRKDPNL